MIQVNGLTKDYGARRAIDNLTFDAEQGEIVGFLGPNGAGKTTTMRILTGYMPPTDGSATVAGYDVVEESLEVRKRVGYLPETVPLYNDMTALDYLKFMADLRHIPDPEERAYETLEGVNLTDRANSYIGTFSKGMRQRIGLAQALIHRPEVLILDEPTIGLDPAQVVEIRNVIREIGKDRTVLLSTHILSEVERLCDRVSIIRAGRTVQSGSLEALRELTRTAVEATLDDPPDAAELAALPGLHDVQIDGPRVSFAVETAHLGEAIEALGRRGIRSLTSQPPTLEELFMSSYEPVAQEVGS